MGTNASSKKSVAWRVLAVLLAALMIVTAIPMSALAKTGDSDDLIIKAISVTTQPTKKNNSYFVGDAVDYTGLVVTAKCITEKYIADAIKDGVITETQVKNGNFKPMLKDSDYYDEVEYTYDEAGKAEFNQTFKLTPAQGYALQIKDDQTKFVVTLKEDKDITCEGYKFKLQGLAAPKFAKLIDDVESEVMNENGKVLAGKNDKFVLVINGYALTHKLSAKEVTLQGKNLGKILVGEKVKIAGNFVEDYTDDMLWQIDADGIYFIDDEGKKWYVDFTGKKSYGDAFSNTIAGTGLFEAGMSDLNEALEITYCGVPSLANNNTTLWATFTDVKNNMFTLEADEKTGYFYGQYRTATDYVDAGTQLWPAANVAGNLGIYKEGTAEISKISITKDPDKMVYNENDQFDPSGMEIKIVFSDGTSDVFDIEDVEALADMMGYEFSVYPDKGDVLTEEDNGEIIGINLYKDNAGDFYAYGNEKLVVKPLVAQRAVLANELVSGSKYIVVAIGDALMPRGTDGNYGVAISSKKKVAYNDYFSAEDSVLDAGEKTLSVVPVKWVNDTIEFMDDSLVWTVVDSGSANTAYNLIDKNGNYLSAVLVDNADVFTLTATKAKNSANLDKWSIPGTNGIEISSANGNKLSNNYKLKVVESMPTSIDTLTSAWEVVTAIDKADKFDEDNSVQKFMFFKVADVKYTSLKIKNQPQLTYVEGDKFNVAPISVELTYNEGSKTVVNYDQFGAYGIKLSGLTNGQVLALSDSGKTVTATMGSLSDTSEGIKVLGSDENKYAIADKLVDGDYIIVWNKLYKSGESSQYKYDKEFNQALSSEKISAEETDTLKSKAVTVDGDYITSKVTDDMIWNIKAIKDKKGEVVSYEIKSKDGKFLELVNDEKNPALYALTTVKALNTKTGKEYLNNWMLTGTKDADMFVYDEDRSIRTYPNLTGKYYLCDALCVEGFDASYALAGGKFFLASTVGTLDSIDLYTVVKPHEVTKLAITTDPAADLLKIAEGDKLANYGDLAVTLTYKDGVKEVVKAADFAAKGITADPALNTAITKDYDKKPITVKLGALSDTTDVVFEISAVTTKATRIAGDDRIATAIEIAKAGWTSSEFVIIANAQNYADALAGVALAKAKNAPILLTNKDALDSRVLEEVKALGATRAIILGGTAAISADVQKALSAANVITSRLGGATRYETAVEIANATNAAPSEIFFVTGKDNSFADALSISSVAAIKGAPVLYVGTGDELNAAVENYLASKKAGITSTCIVGGTAAVSDGIQAKLAALGYTVERVDGATRYETSINVAKKYADAFTSKDVAVATGETFPDALAGGAFAAKNGIPVILVKDGDSASIAAAKAYIDGNFAANVYVFGGVNAISDATVTAIVD